MFCINSAADVMANAVDFVDREEDTEDDNPANTFRSDLERDSTSSSQGL